MAELTMSTTEHDWGYSIQRSDGIRFSLVWIAGGSAVLYFGEKNTGLPPFGIVEFLLDIPEKLDAARAWVLAYPEQPRT